MVPRPIASSYSATTFQPRSGEMSRVQRSKVAMAVSACVVTLLPSALLANRMTWTGAGATKAFNNPNNWTPAIVPNSSDFALIPINGSIQFTATTNTGEVSIANASLTVNESAVD